MRLLIKHRLGRLLLDATNESTVLDLKKKISRKINLSCENFRLVSGIENSSVILEDSYTLDFFKFADNATIDIEITDSNLERYAFRRSSSYLESIGLVESLPSRYSNPLQLVIEYCKQGLLKDLERILEIYEKSNPEDEDLVNQCHPSL